MMQEQEKECCIPLNQIISDFYDKILGYVVKNVKDPHTAQDITQEVMGRLIDAYNKQLPVKNHKAWLFQVTRNVIADHFRKKKVVDYSTTNFDFADDDDEPEIAAEDFIIPMIQLLPEKYAIPLYMSEIEHLKQAVIAEKLGLTLSAAKMRCQRARKKLHKLFLKCCDIEYTEGGAFVRCTIKSTCRILKEEVTLKTNFKKIKLLTSKNNRIL